MFIDFMMKQFQHHEHRDAIVWNDESYPYGWLLEHIDQWRHRLTKEGIKASSVVIIEADFSPSAVALFLALLETGCVLVPLTSFVADKLDKFIKIAQGEWFIGLYGKDQATVKRLDGRADHEMYRTLRERGHPGLVLFSSGSTGASKAALHDLVGILEKFKTPRHSMRAISFLLYDHIGGVNTMLYTLSNTGCLVTVQDRSPDSVLSTIAKHRVELLPTSPTFLNLILLSEAYRRHDVSTLKTVTYGTEPMPESTLKRFHQELPEVRLLQTYGLSEVGILRSKSFSSDSLWVKIGGEGFETRIVDGVLHIKARSAMLGYLNAPSPFTADGWMNTGDQVEQNGEYVRFLGRQAEIINVGGEKVHPAEVESVIQELDNVADVTVSGEKHAFTGQIVCARVTLKGEERAKTFARRLRQFCSERLERFKVPVKVNVVQEHQHSPRFKRVRNREKSNIHRKRTPLCSR